jgi:hypothetical protein
MHLWGAATAAQVIAWLHVHQLRGHMYIMFLFVPQISEVRFQVTACNLLHYRIHLSAVLRLFQCLSLPVWQCFLLFFSGSVLCSQSWTPWIDVNISQMHPSCCRANHTTDITAQSCKFVYCILMNVLSTENVSSTGSYRHLYVVLFTSCLYYRPFWEMF